MKILLLHPPHTAIGSRIPREHLPPLGLLALGGPLLDAGHEVRLLDADRRAMTQETIVQEIAAAAPEVLMVGHSGSSTAHPTIVELCAALKHVLPELTILYGGVHPSYHWDEILRDCPSIDIIVRGEGEQTCVTLLDTLARRAPLANVAGIAYRHDGRVIATPPAQAIRNLDDWRIGWELIDHKDYTYWGGKRAALVQFSRGCPHRCNYCGQRGFWTQWRHRDPVRFARELARLYREEGVELINFADENPTASRKAWRALLEALIAENVPLTLVGSTRAGDIVRDADILHLYRKAGVIRFLLGIESYNEATLQAIGKGSTLSTDQQAIALLRQHGIVSMATCVIGFTEERDRDFWHTFRHLRRYDPDQIQLLYATPHRWTPFYQSVAHRKIIQTDLRRWDYKHQVLANPGVPAWRTFLWFKLIELAMQLRPAAVRRLFHPDADFRHAMRWYTRVGRRVWFHEVAEFLFHTRLLKAGIVLREFLGHSLAQREYVLAKAPRPKAAARPQAEPRHKKAA